MKLFYAGAEQGQWRKLLIESGIKTVSMSYMGLRGRGVKFARPWLVADHFPKGQEIFLDAGAYSLNRKDAETLEEAEIFSLAQHYTEFVAANIDHLAMVSEFDVMSLGLDWLRGMREDFFDELGDKFLPVWHPEYGNDELQSLCDKYPRVGIVGGNSALLAPLVHQHQVKLHGVGMTEMDEMREPYWDSVGSLSWLSPQTNGDTIIWTGRKLQRYPAKLKKQARSRHRSFLVENGFDTDKIDADDTTEVLRLSLWSWEKFVESINSGRLLDPFGSGLTTIPGETGDAETSDTPDAAVDNPAADSLTTELVPATPEMRATKLLPIMENAVIEGDEDTAGQSYLAISDSLHLQCDTCVMRTKCVEFKPGASCAYNIPVKVKTPQDIKHLRDMLIKQQSQRVLIMQQIELAAGGYVDANLSAEIDRLNKLIKAREDAEREGFTLTQTITGDGAPGMLSRVFGQDAADVMSALPQAQTTAQLLGQDEYWDAEVTGEG